jgi:hypothetical protein
MRASPPPAVRATSRCSGRPLRSSAPPPSSPCRPAVLSKQVVGVVADLWDSDEELEIGELKSRMLSIEAELNHNKPRKSVRSSFDMSANTSGEFKISKHPKSEDDRQKLLSALDSLFLFEHLQQHERLQLVDAFAPAAVERGHTIICEGDSENVQHLYVITRGTCTISKRTKDGGTDVVHIARELECFGELALMYNCPRAASVTAAEDVQVWRTRTGRTRRRRRRKAIHPNLSGRRDFWIVTGLYYSERHNAGSVRV